MATLAPRPLPNPTLRVDFDEDTPYPGHTVICRRQVSLEAAMQLQALAQSADDGQQLAAVRRFADLFIVDWTFSEPGAGGDLVKLPVSGDTFVQALDVRVAMDLFRRWTEAVGMQMSSPLGEPSSPGGSSTSLPPLAAVSSGMDPLYESAWA